MITTDIEALLTEPNFCQLGTVNKDGSPHIDTVWFSYDQQQLRIATTQATKKARNLLHNPAAYGVITHRNNPYEQAQLKLRLHHIEADDELIQCDAIALRYTGRPFPQRKHHGRIVIVLDILSCKYHIAKV